ncbi:MAG: BspA family leucine-rich repeat surface protein [Coriobacteriaceae bacterium]|nr:BspA family leucine-rich repeat surface protein [Coriobacteriaceae bacterium]
MPQTAWAGEAFYAYIDRDADGQNTALVLQDEKRSDEQIAKDKCIDLGFSTDAVWLSSHADDITSVRFEVTGEGISPVSMEGWFSGCKNLVSVDLSGLDTSKVKVIAQMFSYCTSLEELDLSAFDDSSLEHAEYLCAGCTSLRHIDLSSFDSFLSSDIVVECENLQSVTLGPNTVLAEYTLYVIDPLAVWDAQDGSGTVCENENEMSEYVASAGEPVTFARRTVIVTEPILSGECGTCVWAIDDDGALTVSPADGVEGWLDEWDGSYFWSMPWSEGYDRVTSATFTGKVHAKTCANMFCDFDKLTSVDLSSLDTSQATSMFNMFRGCASLTSIDLSTFDTSNVESMNGMFGGCTSLGELNMSSFDTSRVTNMGSMFSGLTQFTAIDVTNFDTASVTTMELMFGGCRSLEALDLSSFDTARVKNMDGVFSQCDSLGELRLGTGFAFPEGMDTTGDSIPAGSWESSADGKVYELADFPAGVDATYTKVSNANGVRPHAVLDSQGVLTLYEGDPGADVDGVAYPLMVAGYASEEAVPWHEDRARITRVTTAAGFGDPDNPYVLRFKSFAYWFADCTNLESVNLEGVTMRYSQSNHAMFRSCTALKEITFPDSVVWGKDWSDMFRDCSSIAELDLSRCDTSDATSMRRMLHGCDSLKRVVLGERCTFRGACAYRLPGSELPSGAWRQGDSDTAYRSDSLPNFQAATYTKLTDEELAEPGLTMVAIEIEGEDGKPRLQVESTFEDGEERLDYIVGENYPGDTLYVGDSPRTSSTKTLPASVRTVTKTTLRSVRSDSRITKVVVPSGVTGIEAYAFKGTNVKTLSVKSAKLTTAKSVSKCLSGSKVTKVVASGMSAAKKKAVRNAFSKWCGKKIKSA